MARGSARPLLARTNGRLYGARSCSRHDPQRHSDSKAREAESLDAKTTYEVMRREGQKELARRTLQQTLKLIAGDSSLNEASKQWMTKVEQAKLEQLRP